MSFHSWKLLLPAVLMIFGCRDISAQSFEIFSGTTLGRMNPEDNTNRATLVGWNTSITEYAGSVFGMTADFAGFYGSAHPAATISGDSATGLPPVSVRQYSFMAGPQFRLLRRQRFETSIRALFGATHGSVPSSSIPAGIPAVDYNSLDQTTFSSLIGTNFDVNVSKRMAVRFSPGMYLTRFGGETQKNFRFSVGPVFRFGGGE